MAAGWPDFAPPSTPSGPDPSHGGDQSFSSIIIDPTKFTFDGSPGRFWTAPTWNRAQIQIKEIEGTPNCLCGNVLYRTWLCVESRHGRSDDAAHLRDRQHTLQMA